MRVFCVVCLSELFLLFISLSLHSLSMVIFKTKQFTTLKSIILTAMWNKKRTEKRKKSLKTFLNPNNNKMNCFWFFHSSSSYYIFFGLKAERFFKNKCVSSKVRETSTKQKQFFCVFLSLSTFFLWST